jgi:hypothetical protein
MCAALVCAAADAAAAADAYDNRSSRGSSSSSRSDGSGGGGGGSGSQREGSAREGGGSGDGGGGDLSLNCGHQPSAMQSIGIMSWNGICQLGATQPISGRQLGGIQPVSDSEATLTDVVFQDEDPGRLARCTALQERGWERQHGNEIIKPGFNTLDPRP